MKHKETERTIVTLANASELVVCVIQNIVGNEIADTINGSPLTREAVHHIAQTQFQSALNKQVGV